jgi:Domain of unknown function (DUF1707)/2TM domain
MPHELARMLARSQVRASDEEREHAVRTLRHHFTSGRIAEAELEERVGRAYAAQTRGELDALFADLPYNRSGRHRRRLREMNRAAIRTHAVTYGAVNGGLVAIWAATGGGAFWPGWSMAWWGAALGWHWLASRAVGSALGGRRRELRARRDSRLLSR